MKTLTKKYDYEKVQNGKKSHLGFSIQTDIEGGLRPMDHNLKRFNSTALEYLSEEQMRDIHSAALDILDDCGTVIHHE